MSEPDPENTIGKLAWHVHHSQHLFQALTGPLSVRQNFIRHCKPPAEVPTRLRLLKLIRGPLPPAVTTALAAVNAAQAAFDTARAACAAAWAACTTAQAAFTAAQVALASEVEGHTEEMNALHKQECPDCPWDYEQKTIFPEGRPKT